MATCAIIPGNSGKVTAGAIKEGTAARQSSIYIDPDEIRQPEYTVFVHSISKRSHDQPNAVYGNVIIPACPKDKRYITVRRIVHPTGRAEVNPDNVSGPSKMFWLNGKGLALSIVNPSFVGNDLSVQDREIAAESQLHMGDCDLLKQGVFASLNEEPTEEELKKAEKRREEYYRFRFEQANGLARSNPRALQDLLTLDHHMAAEMFAIDVDWHRVTSPKVECAQCGEKIKEGLSHHFANGRICVLDWERAYLAGAIKKEDVPEGREWWEDEKPKRKPGISAAADAIKA